MCVSFLCNAFIAGQTKCNSLYANCKLFAEWDKRNHLPGLDSDTICCVVHVDVSYSYIGNTCFHVVSSKATNADSMTRTTVYTVDVDVCASCLDGDTVVTYV